MPGDNLLANGGLDDGESGWKRFTDGNVGLTITDGDFCGNAIRIDINRAGTKSQLFEGDKVTYEVEETPKGLNAINVEKA